MPTRRRLLICLALGAAAWSFTCAAQAQSGAQPRDRKAAWNTAPHSGTRYADAAEQPTEQDAESRDEGADADQSLADRRRPSGAAPRELEQLSPALSRDSRRSRDRDADYVQPASYVEDSTSTAHKRTSANEPATADRESPSASPAGKSQGKSLPLATKRLPGLGESVKNEQPAGWSALISVGGSLTIVLGLFLAVVWFLRRTTPKSSAILPNEVFEVLGRAPLAGRQTAQLVRCGAKLLLISVTPGGSETLTEITDAVEVDRLAGLCQQSRGTSASATFRNLFSQFATEPAAPATKTATPARGLFAQRDSRLTSSDKLIDDFAADRALTSSRREGRDA